MDIVLLWAGAGLFAFGVMLLLLENRMRQNQVLAEGQIVGYSKAPPSQNGTPMYRAVMSYTGVDGRARLVESQIGGSMPIGFVGKKVKIYLHQDDPGYAEPDRGVTTAISCGITFVGAFLMALFFRRFQTNYISIGMAAFVSASIAHQLWQRLHALKLGDKTVREMFEQSLKSHVFFSEARGQIPWADTTSLSGVIAAKAKGQRSLIPLLFAFSVGGIALSCFLYQRESTFLSKTQPAEGRVVELIESRSSKSTTTYRPLVEFTPAGTTQPVRFKHSISSSPPSYQVGERVAVIFDPSKPKSAQIDLGIWNQLGAIICGAVGVLSALLLAHLLKQKRAASDGLPGAENSPQQRAS